MCASTEKKCFQYTHILFKLHRPRACGILIMTKHPALYRRGRKEVAAWLTGRTRRVTAPCSMPAAGTAALCCRVWRWGCGTTSARRIPSAPCAKRCARRSTAASLILTLRTITALCRAARRKISAVSCTASWPPTATSLLLPPKRATACGPAPMAAEAAERPCWPAWTKALPACG